MTTWTEESEPMPLEFSQSSRSSQTPPNYMVDIADFARLERKVDKLTDALNRIVVFEERQLNQASGLTEARKDLEKFQDRMNLLEQKVDRWINRGIGIWLVLGLLWGAINFYFVNFPNKGLH